MLLTRYNQIEYILKMNYIKGYELVLKAFEMYQDDRLFQRWITGPHREVGFNEFKKELIEITNKPPEKSEDEIFKTVADIIDTFNKGVN